MTSVVVVGASRLGKSALWLGLAKAFEPAALRLEGRDGGTERVPWPVARGRYGRTGWHGVRVARVALRPELAPAGARGAWTRALRLVDGPGIDGDGGPRPAGRGDVATLLAEAIAADLLVHVVGGAQGRADEAVRRLAAARGIPVETVVVQAGRGGVSTAGRRLRLDASGWASGRDALRLGASLARRLAAVRAAAWASDRGGGEA